MEVMIKGAVVKNPVMLEECCLFAIQRDDDVYLVISTDKQAAKDNIFVEEKQQMSIVGSYKPLKGVILTSESKIELERNNKIK